MKTIGLIGGMSWESTASYYQAINRGIKQHLGGLHSAKLVLVSVDFAEIEQLQHAGDWQATAEILAKAARSIQGAGAEGFLICTNTMHKVANEVQASVDIPLLHIADGTALELKVKGVQRVGLLGTSFTMEQHFYTDRLRDHGLEVVIPNAEQRALVHRVIYQELCLGEVKPSSRDAYLEIIDSMVDNGVQAVILGCTEIGLLIQQRDTSIPLFDTTIIHAHTAVNFMLA